MDASFVKAIESVFVELSKFVFDGKKPENPVIAYIAGGSACYLYTGIRMSHDVDAEFSLRIIRPDVIVSFTDEQGIERTVHLDTNYSNTLGLMHDEYDKRALSSGLVAQGFQIMLLAPADLAISKLARFAEHDQSDIFALIQHDLIDRVEFETLANDALGYFVGNVEPVRTNLRKALTFFDQVHSDISTSTSKPVFLKP